MKNVTVSLDDELHRRARIRAAELGTSLSALVKQYLESLALGARPEVSPEPVAEGVREMPVAYRHAPAEAAEGPPYLVNGQWVWTKDGKPRQPGALRGMWIADDFDEWPDDILKSFEAWGHDDPEA